MSELVDLKHRIEAYWDRQPCNSKWRDRGWDYTEHKKLVEPHIWEWSDFSAWKGKRVLDLGCGIGTMAIEFADAHATVVGVDISEESLGMARHRAFGYSPVHLSFHRQDIEDLSLLGMRNWFDLVYSFGVLHHTPNPLAALQRAWYHLKPGGELWFMVYNRWGWKRLIRGRPEAQGGCPLVTYWAPKKVRHLLREAHFEPYDFQVRHIFPFVGEEYGKGNLVLASPWNVPFLGSWLYRLLEPIFGQHLLVKARKLE